VVKLGILGSCASIVFSLTCVAAAHAQSLAAEFAAAAGSATPLLSASQIVDRPPAATPGRSVWGVVGGVTPKWWLPDAWKSIVEDARTLEGRELRIGIRRGRPLGYEFGFSFVRKSMTQFLFEDDDPTTFFMPGESTPHNGVPVTFTPIETVQIPGLEYYSFIPIGKIGSRVQLGTLLSFGAGHVPSTAVRQRIEGPPFYATTDDFTPLLSPPANGGFVRGHEFNSYFPVPPGQTAVEVTENFRDVWFTDELIFLIRAQIAADVLIAPPFKLRFSGGFNYPGAQRIGIEAVYLFGGGR
jgi:hypothetical protein